MCVFFKFVLKVFPVVMSSPLEQLEAAHSSLNWSRSASKPWMKNTFPQRRPEEDSHSTPDKMTTIYLHLVGFLISTSGLLITVSTAEISGFHPLLPPPLSPAPLSFFRPHSCFVPCTFKNPHPVSQVSFSLFLFPPPSNSLFFNK